MCRQNRFKSASTPRDEWQVRINSRMSRQTVNQRLLSRVLRARRPAKKPPLTHQRKRNRLDWARQHRHRQLGHWRHVLVSDESRFVSHHNDGRARVRRERGQRFPEDTVMPRVAHGGGSGHVWAGIHYGDGTTLVIILHQNVNAESYTCTSSADVYGSICKVTLRQKLSLPASVSLWSNH